VEDLSHRQIARLDARLIAGDPTCEVTVAWQYYQQLRSIYDTPNCAAGRRAEQAIGSLGTCPIGELPDWGAPCGPGDARSWPTSTPAVTATAAPRRSTE